MTTSDSEEDSDHSPVEVTHEDFQKYYDESKSKRFRFRNLLPKKQKSSLDVIDGNLSVAALTVTSIDTIKASNQSRKAAAAAAKKKAQNQEKAPSSNKGFKKFRKKMLGAIKSSDEDLIQASASIPPPILGTRSRSEIAPRTPTRRTKKPSAMKRVSSDPRNAVQRRIQLDDAIRGRMDGMDVLSLGPARLPLSRKKAPTSAFEKFVDTMNPSLTPSAMVMRMIVTSAGRESSEMVLESFMPGDRWMVRREEEPVDEMLASPATRRFSPVPTLSSTDEDECGSSVTCGDEDLTRLMGSMWGTENKAPPTHSQPPQTDQQSQDDDIMQLASACNVPIDIDEDTFIIETPHHLHSIHEIAAIPLRRGDYENALKVFEKILKGLQSRHEHKPHHLIGSTLHNIGVVQMWQGKFAEALYSFLNAVAMRREALPTNHPDIAVSLVRQGFAQLALDQLGCASDSFKQALDLCPLENASRAKILNNLGVVQYLKQDLISAVKGFTSALEIQRKQLTGRIRRETIIFDATNTLSNMGKLYLEKPDFDTSFFVYDEAILVSVDVLSLVLHYCASTFSSTNTIPLLE
jgi:hypothetical protein